MIRRINVDIIKCRQCGRQHLGSYFLKSDTSRLECPFCKAFDSIVLFDKTTADPALIQLLLEYKNTLN